MSTRWRLIGALVLGGAPALSCGGAPRSVDDTASEITRVVSLVPAITDLAVALGAGDRLVGRAAFDTDSSLAHLPLAGGVLQPNLEVLLALRPQLVFAWSQPRLLNTLSPLADRGVQVRAVDVQTVEDVRRTVLDLGRIFRMEAAADSLLASIDTGLRAVASRKTGGRRRSVLLLVSHTPPIAAGPGTLPHDLIGIAGGENVVADAESSWPMVSLETIVARDPHVVVLALPASGSPVGSPLALPAVWHAVPAVRAGRVFAVDETSFTVPGTRLVEGAAGLADILHGAIR